MRRQFRLLGAAVPVTLDPVLRLAGQKRQASGAWSLPLHAHSRVLLTFGGTAALYQAALALHLVSGDKVLVPSYNCGHEIEPFLRAGAQVGCYRVTEQLEIDLDHLAASIERNTRAILITHYFGFPQPVQAIRELCDRHGVALIEDCAHALFSCSGDEPLGLAGHFAIFSLRKTLALPHGGALVCHDPRWTIARSLARPPLLSTVPKLLERYQKAWLLPPRGRPGLGDRAAFVATRLAVDVVKGARSLAHALGATQLDPDEESLDFPDETLNWGVAKSAENLLLQAQVSSIVAARRRNYAQLLAHSDRFRACRPALPHLPPGVCPLYFPAFTDDTDKEVGRLHQGAVSAIHWWSTLHSAVPWEQFPEAVRLKQRLIAFPVHQDLGDVHIQRVAELLVKS